MISPEAVVPPAFWASATTSLCSSSFFDWTLLRMAERSEYAAILKGVSISSGPKTKARMVVGVAVLASGNVSVELKTP